MNRRNALRLLSTGAAAAGANLFAAQAFAQETPKALNGLAPVKIRDIKTIMTAPDGIRLVIVKVETTEPGLHGWGCATFTQRAYVVQTAVEKYLKPFLIGRNGELFNTQHEYVPLIKDRLIDFIRIHISQIGGLSPARKIQALSEFFGVRTAWHGPGDASPVAHAAQLALELASYNFGIHEGYVFRQNTKEVFAGCPEVRNGYMYAQEKPGLGLEVDEKLAAKFPYPDGPPNFDYNWGATRKRDGTVIRP